MKTSKTITLAVAFICAAILFTLICIPTVLAYEWLNPVSFWERFTFGVSVFAFLSVPFGTRTTRKTGSTNPGTANSYTIRPASLTHREMYAGMRDSAERYGVLKRAN